MTASRDPSESWNLRDALSWSGSGRQLLREVLPHLIELLHGTSGAILIREPEAAFETVAATDGESRIVQALAGLAATEAEALTRMLEATALPVVIGAGAPALQVPDPLQQAAGASSGRHLLLPLAADDGSGAVVVAGPGEGWPQPAGIDEARANLKIVAHVAFMQLKLASARARASTGAADGHVIADLWRAESSADLMRRLARAVVGMAQAHTAAAGLVTAGVLEYREAVVDDEIESIAIRHVAGQHPQGRVLATGELQQVPDGARPRLLVVPVMGGDGSPLAVFEVHPRPGHWLPTGIASRLSGLAEVASSALTTIMQKERAVLDAAAWTDLLPLVRGLAQAESAEALYAALQAVAGSCFAAESAWLAIAPKGGGDWPAWTGEPYLQQLRSAGVALTAIPQHAMAGLDAEATDLFELQDTGDTSLVLGDVARSVGVSALLGLRIVIDGHFVGVAAFAYGQPRAFGPDERRRLQLVTNDIVAAVQRVASAPVSRRAPPEAVTRMHALGTVASGVAHGLNNAIGGILGHLELAEGRPTLDEVRGDLSWIRGSAEQAAETLRRVQIATGVRVAREFEPISINDAARAAVESLRGLLRHSDQNLSALSLETDLHASGTVLGNAAQLEEAVVCLLSNAVEAIDASGIVTVSTWTTDKRTFLQVADDGPGIDPRVRDRIFEPFVSGKPGSARGLGMPIAASIVAAHQGSIAVDSAENQGTRITIELLADDTEAKVAPSVTEPAPEEVVGARILLVEDENSVRVATEQMLARDGHDVVSVADAQAALAAFTPEQFDLIVTDLGLPLTSGWSLLKEIRDLDPGVPALVMTGYGERADPERQSELSVHVVLAKPFLGAELRSAIDRALRAGV